MIKSEEQLDIIASAKALTAGQILKIDAFAGAAKTSTLVMIAEEVIENSICLVFNKSAQLEAVERFPDHVECRTTHSLAYQATGLSIQHKLSRPQGRYVNVLGTGNEIAKHFKLEPFELGDGQKPVTAALLGLFIRNTCNKYEQSRDKDFTEEHLIHNVREYKGKSAKALRKLVMDKARELWKMRSDPSSPVLATHDTYLKMYQLSEPKLRYDVIYLDESQDSNDCVLDIVTKQNAKLILVGDSRQAIYGWRGAVNALDKVQENTIAKRLTTTKRLTTSYRYGQDSADIAAKILDSDVSIKSFEGLVTKVGDDVIDKSKPYTILYRTNEALVLDAVNSISQGLVVNLEIDTKDFCNLLDSSIALYRDDMAKVKHEDLVAFENFDDLKDEAKNSASLTRIVNLIESGHCWKVLRTLRDHKNHPNPNIIYTTAHKSKGREWSQVQLANDFPSHYDREKNWVGLTTEEQNLLYVAATRARNALNINKTISEIYIEQPRSSVLEINIKQISVLSAGGSKQVVFSKDTGGGEMAEAALEYASQTSEQAISYLDGDMSDEDAYESGLVDELGNYNFSGKDLSPTGEDMIKVSDYESTCNDLHIAELGLVSYTGHN